MSGRRKSLESVPPLHDDLLSPVAFSPCMLCLQSEFGGGGDGTALHNQVFYSVVNNRPVVMEELRKSIAKMVTLVTRKNHWFCVWSVLKHHNLIRVFSEYDYTQWDKEMFLEKKKIFGMKKWSESLFDTFSTLCRDMEKSIWGHQFLG